jgi:hypothetical protein
MLHAVPLARVNLLPKLFLRKIQVKDHVDVSLHRSFEILADAARFAVFFPIVAYSLRSPHAVFTFSLTAEQRSAAFIRFRLLSGDFSQSRDLLRHICVKNKSEPQPVRLRFIHHSEMFSAKTGIIGRDPVLWLHQ